MEFEDPCVLEDDDELLLSSLLAEEGENGLPPLSDHGSSTTTEDDQQKKPSSSSICLEREDSSIEPIQIGHDHEEEINNDDFILACRLQRLEEDCRGAGATGTTGTPTHKICRWDVSNLQREEENEVKMLSTPSGKAWKLVEQVCQLFSRHEEGTGLTGLISPIGMDDLFFVAERFFQTWELFFQQGKPCYIDLGYHYTRSRNLDRIRTDGLLTRHERESLKVEAKFNGSRFGDGIYTAKNPFAFHGRYGDVGLIVARLHGCVGHSIDVKTPFDSVRMHQNQRKEFSVLKTCGQCLPMFQFKTSLIKPHEREHQGNLSLFRLHEDLQALINKLLCNNQDTTMHSARHGFLNDSPTPYTPEFHSPNTSNRTHHHLITPPATRQSSNGTTAAYTTKPIHFSECQTTTIMGLTRERFPFQARHDTKKVYHADMQNNVPQANNETWRAELGGAFQCSKRASEDCGLIPASKKMCIDESGPFPCANLSKRDNVLDIFHHVREANFSTLTQKCSICLDTLMRKKNGKMVQLNLCGHYFHENCLTESIKQFEACPLCKLPFIQDSGGDHGQGHRETKTSGVEKEPHGYSITCLSSTGKRDPFGRMKLPTTTNSGSVSP